MSDSEDGDLSYDDFVLKHQDRLPLHGRSSDCHRSEDEDGDSSGDDDSQSSDDDEEEGGASDAAASMSEGCLTFEDFEDLKKHVQGIFKCKMSNNKRTTRSPPQWFKKEYPDVQVAWLNGTLYCHQPKQEHDAFVPWAKTTCHCHARYSLCSDTLRWRLGSLLATHNHDIATSSCAPSATGLVHIRSAEQLSQDMIRSIINWFDAKINTKEIRFHFKAKYPDHNIKAPVIRSLRTQYKQRNAPNNGMDALIEQLRLWDEQGGVGKFQYANLQITGIQFQVPFLFFHCFRSSNRFPISASPHS
jgi:hypothetical protein